MNNDFLQQSMFSTQQIANGDHISGLVGLLLILFVIAVSVVAYKMYEFGLKKGEKLSNEKLQQHVLTSQLMRELGMAAPGKQSVDPIGAKPVVTPIPVAAAAVPSAQALPVLPPLPAVQVASEEVEEFPEPSNDVPAPVVPMSDDDLVDDLENELRAGAVQ